jgi:hypothetical protein
MPDPLEKRLAALPAISKAALCDLWKQFFHSAPSSELRRDLMIPILILSNARAGIRIAQRPCSGTTS